jgi:UDP-perosamine 4-acetyltransferase
MTERVILIGCGGHARVLTDCLRQNRAEIIGYTAPVGMQASGNMASLQRLGDDEALMHFDPATVMLVNGVGSVRSPAARREVFDRLKSQSFKFAVVTHSRAIIADCARLEEGAQVMAGAVVQAGAVIRANTIINTAASVDHDCVVGAHVHVACGAVLSGGVCVGDGSHIGTGALIAQSVTIGKDCLVAMGAAVRKDVADRDFVAGVPAQRVGSAGVG